MTDTPRGEIVSLLTSPGGFGLHIRVGRYMRVDRIEEIVRGGDGAAIVCYLVTYRDGSTMEINGRHATEIRRRPPND